MKFTWDEEKNERNKKNHRISFQDASRVFFRNPLIMFDMDHSDSEDRYTAYGFINEILLRVTFTMDDDDLYRLISARKATIHEEEAYYRRRF